MSLMKDPLCSIYVKYIIKKKAAASMKQVKELAFKMF